MNRFSREYARMSASNISVPVSNSSGALWSVLSADVDYLGGAPLPQNQAIGGTWDVTTIGEGCDGASINPAGSVITFTKSGLYEVSFQVQFEVGATPTSTNNGGVVTTYLGFLGNPPLNLTQIKASATFVSGTGIGVSQLLIFNAYGYIDIVEPVGAQLTPSIDFPLAAQCVGDSLIAGLNGATYLIIKRVA